MTTYITNAFSFNMVPAGATIIHAARVEPTTVRAAVENGALSAVGHADTAVLVSGILGVEVAVNRVTVTLNQDDHVYVAQYRGPRLPEGVKTLPEGSVIEFWEVFVVSATPPAGGRC